MNEVNLREYKMEFTVTKEEGLKRLGICKKCEFFKDKPIVPQIYCDKCKCVMKLKVYLKGATCPIQKW